MGSIHTHVSNFIDTWEGWAHVIKGLSLIDFEGLYQHLQFVIKEFGSETSSLFSSK